MERPKLYGDKSSAKGRKNGNIIQERADKLKEDKGDPRKMMKKKKGKVLRKGIGG